MTKIKNYVASILDKPTVIVTSNAGNEKPKNRCFKSFEKIAINLKLQNSKTMVALLMKDLPSVVVTSCAGNEKGKIIRLKEITGNTKIKLTICSNYFWCWKWKRKKVGFKEIAINLERQNLNGCGSIINVILTICSSSHFWCWKWKKKNKGWKRKQ